MDEQGVCFRTKGGKTVTLAPQEFIRRFLLHVLPSGDEETEDWIARLLRLCGLDITRCPACTAGRMVRQPLPPSPPLHESPQLGADSS